MRRVNGRRNRILVAIIGIFFIVCGVFGLIQATGRAPRYLTFGKGPDAIFTYKNAPLFILISGIVIIVLSLIFIVLAIPASRRASALRYESSFYENSLTNVEPTQIAQAAAASTIQDNRFIKAKYTITGSRSAPTLYARVAVSSKATITDAVTSLIDRHVSDMEYAIESQFIEKHICLEVAKDAGERPAYIDIGNS